MQSVALIHCNELIFLLCSALFTLLSFFSISLFVCARALFFAYIYSFCALDSMFLLLFWLLFFAAVVFVLNIIFEESPAISPELGAASEWERERMKLNTKKRANIFERVVKIDKNVHTKIRNGWANEKSRWNIHTHTLTEGAGNLEKKALKQAMNNIYVHLCRERPTERETQFVCVCEKIYVKIKIVGFMHVNSEKTTVVCYILGLWFGCCVLCAGARIWASSSEARHCVGTTR